ncbi:MAG: Ldh family oxidoreductase [Betaproteobacteria bacterium]|nr:Ldh family oxidoreductase [Betaproteobacteria bacterium]
MQLAVAEATDLAVRVLTRYGMSEYCAKMVAEHLVDAALCGHEFSSLARLPILAALLRNRPPAGEIRVVRETENSALIDGGDNIAYAVSVVAIDKAIELCRKSGIAIVSANNTWFSGRLAYYVERAARQGFIGMNTVHGTARTAPFGGMEALLGTNPFAIAFPSEDEPVIIDMSTSATTHGAANLAKAKGETLPEGLAVDSNGRPTVDPDAALKGAFLTWGGHRGYGISLALQLLGMLAGSEPVVKDDSHFGLFFLVIDPGLMMPGGQYQARVSELKKIIASTRPAAGVKKVRVPGERSLRHRRRALAAGAAAVINVDDKVYSRIRELLV